MPKRPYSDDDSPQVSKVQLNGKHEPRKIRSLSSEKALQMLFSGASRQLQAANNKCQLSEDNCCPCDGKLSCEHICNYCEKKICGQCTNVCYKCERNYCTDCSYLTYDHREAVCFSC